MRWACHESLERNATVLPAKDARRGAWTHFVTGLGLAPSTDIPVAQLVALVVLALASATVIAFLPARAATRVVPARILRSE